jgi:hypothetical protein
MQKDERHRSAYWTPVFLLAPSTDESTMSTPPIPMSDELYARATKLWPRITEMLRERIEAIQEEMEKSIDTNDAFALIDLLMLNEVFLRKTIVIAAGRDDTDDIPAWIEQLYNDWNTEAKNK